MNDNDTTNPHPDLHEDFFAEWYSDYNDMMSFGRVGKIFFFKDSEDFTAVIYKHIDEEDGLYIYHQTEIENINELLELLKENK